MTTLEILEGARDLIRNKDDWFGGDSPIVRRDQNCAWTALINCQASRPDRESLALGAWSLLTEITKKNVMCFNDTHTHAEMLEIFNIAIARLQGEQCATTGEKSNTTMLPTDTGLSTPVENELLSPA